MQNARKNRLSRPKSHELCAKSQLHPFPFHRIPNKTSYNNLVQAKNSSFRPPPNRILSRKARIRQKSHKYIEAQEARIPATRTWNRSERRGGCGTGGKPWLPETFPRGLRRQHLDRERERERRTRGKWEEEERRRRRKEQVVVAAGQVSVVTRHHVRAENNSVLLGPGIGADDQTHFSGFRHRFPTL